MKNALAFILSFIAATSFALNIATTDRKLYQDCEVKAVEKDGVRIMHRDGSAFLDFDTLPSALQKQFGWTAEKSAARKAERAAEAERQRIAAEKARRAMEERAAAIKAQAEAKAEAEKQRLEEENARRATEERVAAAKAQVEAKAEVEWQNLAQKKNTEVQPHVQETRDDKIKPVNKSANEKSQPNITWIFTIFAIVMVVKLIEFVARNRRLRALEILDIDFMSGVEFEQYLQKLLTFRGYRVRMTPSSGDLGVDLVASSSGEKIAIQVKRYSNKVDRTAISDAVAGKYNYNCDTAMVITNNYFRRGAIDLARSTGCILVDRDTLAEWIVEYQKGGG
jgi:restriction system protein